MGWFKKIIGSIPVEVRVSIFEKFGYVTNSSIFNITTSTSSLIISGRRAGLSIWKGIHSPTRLCRALYFTSATCDSACCVSSIICTLACSSPFAPFPAITGGLGYVCKKTADGCIVAAVLCDKPGLSPVEKMRILEDVLRGR
jgi:hypothetical protein